MRVGAVDIGSNSIRLLVAEIGPDRESLETVARAGEPCRLGKGLLQTGEIEPELIERAGDIAREFVRRARSLGARHLVVAATAALRSARNGDQAARRIGERCGSAVRVLSGDDEARLVYRAVIAGFGHAADRSPCVVFDLGGGSTEVVSGLGSEPGRWTSLPFGAVTLTEQFIRSDPPSDHELMGARSWVSEKIMHGCAYMPSPAPFMVGVGGTVTVLASVDRGLHTYEPALLEGWRVPLDRARAHIGNLLTASRQQRLELPVMGEGRADIIAAGAIAVEGLLDRFQPPALVCSTQGLRYALARLAADEVYRGTRADGTPNSH